MSPILKNSLSSHEETAESTEYSVSGTSTARPSGSRMKRPSGILPPPIIIMPCGMLPPSDSLSCVMPQTNVRKSFPSPSISFTVTAPASSVNFISDFNSSERSITRTILQSHNDVMNLSKLSMFTG